MTLINIHSHKISFISKLLWANLISPTGWAELSKAKNELEEQELLYFFKGLTLALVTITSLTTVIGYKLYYLLPSAIGKRHIKINGPITKATTKTFSILLSNI